MALNVPSKKKNKRKIWLGLLLAVLFILGSGFFYVKHALGPVDVTSEETVTVEIPTGTSRQETASILAQKDLIHSGFIFNLYLKLTDSFKGVQAGGYELSPQMDAKELAEALSRGGSDLDNELRVNVTIPEGLRLEQIAEIVGTETDFSADDFMEQVTDESFLNTLYEKYPELLAEAKDAADVRYVLEGYLYPATYPVYQKTTLPELIEEMVRQMDLVYQEDAGDVEQSPLTFHEVLTLASLVEQEGRTATDRKKIAGVFFNRLDDGMMLQTDISILYALNEIREHVTYKDLEVDSPYNTYRHEGLPPGPVANPSREAIEAVLSPTDSDNIYFLADIKTGKVYYAETFEKHLEYKEKYLPNEVVIDPKEDESTETDAEGDR